MATKGEKAMRKKLETIISLIAAELSSFYIVLYVLKENELLRVVFGTFLLSVGIFGLFMLLFEIADVREKRKNKKKSIDDLSLE